MDIFPGKQTMETVEKIKVCQKGVYRAASLQVVSAFYVTE